MFKYKYDPSRVRASFRHKYCKELDLPSGKPSGIEIFPITAEEIDELMGNCQEQCPDGGEWITISEWMLWSALRLKYGIRYLNPTPKCLCYFVSNYDIKEENELDKIELKMQEYVDNEIQFFNKIIYEKFNDYEKKPVESSDYTKEDFKKYFKNNLDF